MHFILSKGFVNIKTILQNYCAQCLYWLKFFFWVYVYIMRLKSFKMDQAFMNNIEKRKTVF